MFSGRNKKLILLCTMLVTALSFAGNLEDEGLLFCSCPENVVLNTELPMSHPINRCATQQASSVSWMSWFTGSSANKQFHYLDLLELLTRVDDPAQSTSSNG